MRAIKLVMTGFESYCDRTEIDFEKLGKSGIYLISGDTGSGKTTIFDAIMFALYGKASGENRSDSMLRSDFASPDIPTEVELTFEANGKLYHVKRNPTYMRRVKNGDGVTEQKAQAVLSFLSEPDLPPIDGKSPVDKKIVEIVKFSDSHFSRIAMIAQGQFQKILLEDSKTKQKLFTDLFCTQNYERLSSRLREDTKKCNQDLELLKSNKENELSSFSVSEADEDYQTVMKIKNSLLLTEEDIGVLQKFNEKNNEKLSALSEKIEKTEKEISEVEISINDENQRLSLLGSKNEFEASLEAMKKDSEAKQKAFEEAQKNLKQKDGLISEQALIRASLAEFEKLNEIKESLNQVFSQISSEKTELEKLEQEKISMQENVSLMKTEIENLKDAEKNILIAKNSLEKLTEQSENLESIVKKIKDYNANQDTLKAYQKQFKESDSKLREIEAILVEKRHLYFIEQAGILAENLEDGNPCPVCGSTTHPNKAKKSEKAPKKEELDDLENQVSSVRKQAGEDSERCSRENASVQEKRKMLAELLESFSDKFSIEDQDILEKLSSEKERAARQISETRQTLQEESERENRRTALEDSLEKSQKDIESNSEKINQLAASIAGLTSTKNALENSVKEKEQKVNFSSIEDARQKDAEITGKIENLEQEAEHTQEALQEHNEKINQLKGQIEQIKASLKGMKVQDIEKLEENKQFLYEKKRLDAEKRDELNSKKGLNESALSKLRQLRISIEDCERRCQMISSLSDVANGTTRGMEKISLESFVQMKYLDNIINFANIRFKIMSNNKYQLIRHRDENESQGQHALDLDVKDFYTGKKRQAGSLSGGEQFQASLSLALGLADEISSSNGGKKLDSMFIDEGFGTLDPETLNKAMKALEDLSKGDKLVGIISHVEGLEERIPSKIMVKKDQSTGKSSVEIITD